MSACGGTRCEKRDQCARYVANRESGVMEQYIDWSEYGSGSMGIDEHGNTFCEHHWDCGDFSDGYPMFQQRELNPEYDWISCSLRNPEIYGKYLVTCKGMDIVQIRLFEGEWDSSAEVIAWKDLPKIYKQ